MAKKTEKKSKSESKTPELTKAKKALDAYLKENKLDPTKDWTKDKKHGKKVTELVNKLNKERDKVAAAYPEADQENNKKLVKLKEKEKKEKDEKKSAKEKKEKDEKKSAKEKKEKKGNGGRTATKYDYPLIDGREMTSAEKKKYRMEQRKLASGKAPKEEKETKKKKEEKVKEKPASDKKDKKAKDKKKKKAAKEED